MPCKNVRADNIPDDVKEQLALIENSRELIQQIMLGIALQYKSLDMQKCLILNNAQNPGGNNTCGDPKAVQIAASLIILCALFGFQRQAESVAGQTAAAGVCPDLMEPRLNATVILVALFRLCRIIAQKNAEENVQALDVSANPEA